MTTHLVPASRFNQFSHQKHLFKGQKVAIKQMGLSNDNAKLLVTEISIMKSSRHPAVVYYNDSFMVDEQLWVVMELMDGGCLTEILEQFGPVRMSEAQIAYVCRETLNALVYIHSLHRIHRDIVSFFFLFPCFS